jgi:ATP-dependent Clp protease ATP-binding subunit ClpA
MGARPMARLIQEKLKKALAEDILFGELTGGGDVYVTADKDIEIEIKGCKQKSDKAFN